MTPTSHAHRAGEMSADQPNVREYYLHLCEQLNAAAKARDEDLARINSRPFSLLRDHEVRVRQARYVLETAEIEAARIHTMMADATSRIIQPIVKVFGP